VVCNPDFRRVIMSTIPTSHSDQADAHKVHLVEVTIEVTDEENGETQTTTHQIPRGETPVPTLETELGITEVEQLWVIQKDGTRKPLASHEKTDVRAGDRYQAVVKGGIS
jgi:hypothetical protein